VKLIKMGTLVPGPAAYALGALMVVLGAIASGLDPGAVWDRLEAGSADRPAGLHVACQACHQVVAEGPARCPRCGGRLRRRKRDSVARTWALLAAAAILYLPANLLAVMRVSSLGHRQADTILSGVLYFFQEGSWHLALVIFIASIVVPVAKMGALGFLLVSVQRRSRWRPGDRTRLYLLTELVGRWSMVDIYVITLMVALVELGALATVEPGPGATAFAAVVVLTLLAAKSFDPRLIWDGLEDPHD
jgi:paraquat-inducible protein A